MKKIILIALMLFISYPISAQELEDYTTETGKPVILERKIPKGEEQPPKAEDNILNPEEKTKNPPDKKELTPKINKEKSNKPKYPGLTIYDKPENKPCGNCYYYYEKKYKANKYNKNIYYNRKAMTNKEKKEQEEQMKNLPRGFKIKKDKRKKICK